MTVSTTWTAEEIREELHALEASKAFRRSPGLVSLLRFVVETELTGSGADLKETYLGVSVYRRPPNYDPKADGIVRVNANRLRKRLLDHYRQFPSRIQITVEPGSYRPVFVVEPPPAPEPIATPTPVPQPPEPRRLSMGWAASALLLLIVGPLTWAFLGSQERWTQRGMSGMSGVQQFPSFSSDSQQVVYAVYDASTDLSSLYSQQLSSNTPVKLTTDLRYESRPALSADGNRLAFIVRDANHTVHIIMRALKEGTEQEIYSHAATGPWLCDVSRVTWTRDYSEILTTAPPSPEERAANPSVSPGCGIIAIDIKTHRIRRLTHSPTGTQGDLEPAISFDGKTVAFVRQIGYTAFDLYLVDLNGTHERRLFSVRDDIQGINWIPGDRKLLLCARMGAAQLRILALDINSGKISVVHSSAAPVAFAAISPDGRHIAYTEYHQQNKMLRLQRGRTQTVFDDGVLRQNVTLSPNGSRLAYSSDRTGQNEIWTSDADGHNETRVTASAGMALNRPIWSADGKTLVFECREKAPSAICALNLASHRISVLVRMKHDAILPSLSRDGTRLYFTSNDTGTYEGYRQRLRIAPNGDLFRQSTPEQMTTGGTALIHESPSEKMLYLRGQLPSLRLLAAPLKEAPINTDPNNISTPRYFLEQQGSASVDDCDTLTEEGLLVDVFSDGIHHFRLYKEGTSNFTEVPAPPISEPVDSVAWDNKQKAILVTTRSTPVGALIALTN